MNWILAILVLLLLLILAGAVATFYWAWNGYSFGKNVIDGPDSEELTGEDNVKNV